MKIYSSVLAISLSIIYAAAWAANDCGSTQKISDYIKYNDTLSQLEEVIQSSYSDDKKNYCVWIKQRDNYITEQKFLDIGHVDIHKQCDATKKLTNMYLAELTRHLAFCESDACDTAKYKARSLGYVFSNNLQYSLISTGADFSLNKVHTFPDVTLVHFNKSNLAGTCGDFKTTFLFQGSYPQDKDKFLNPSIDQHTFPEIKPIKYQPKKADALFDQLFSQHEYTYTYEEKPEYTNDQYFCYSQTFYHYTGGAHGNSNIMYLTLDKKTGQKLKLEQVLDIKHKADILRLAKINLYARYKLDESKNLTDNGFWFDDKSKEFESDNPWIDEEGFYLPDNFIIQEDGIAFLYQPYEVAPYATGTPKINIYWNEVDDL
tara:strand:+ start:91238 stop:92359 length:1122 start_codon:yes stop_codon:yes gene_type:complete